MDFVKTKAKKKTSKSNLFTKIKGITFLILFLGLILLVYYLKIPAVGRTNLALVNDNLMILSLEREKNTLTIVTFPEDLHLNLPQGKGQIPISKLPSLDEIEGYKGQLLKQTLREFLGIPIDGFIKILSLGEIQSVDDFVKLRDHQFNLLDLRRLYFEIRKVRSDKITIIDLRKSNILQKQILPDSSEIVVVDPTDLDGITSEKFYEWKILDEGLTIAVFNGTETAGLANRVSRIITNMGGNVVMVGDSSDRVVDCLINSAKNNQKSYTVDRLKKIFSCEVNDITEADEDSRADIILTLGSKYERVR